MKFRNTAIVLNGFIHDFATGYWLSALIVIRLLNDCRGRYPDAATILAGIQKFFFWNSVAAVVIIFATGGARAFTYVNNFYGPEAERTRRRMLIAKHIFLCILFGAGGWWAYSVVFQ